MPLIAYKRKRFNDDHRLVIDRSNKILHEYAAQGYDLTLRQLYYQHVARGFIANSDREYKRLGSIVSDARMGGLIDWDHIVDRTRFLRTVSSWDSPAQIVRGAARGYQRDLWENQDVRIEVWVEKDALVGVIERACSDLRVPFLSCRGYTSASEMWGASQRFMEQIEDGKRVVVLHLGDHDPSGIDMSRDIEERILHFIGSDHYRLTDYELEPEEAADWAAEHFELRRLALNWDQVQQYNPPPNPAKMTDSRGAGYVQAYGRQSWELDALEPTVIGELIREAVDEERDDERWQVAAATEEAERETLQAAAGRWVEVAQFLSGAE